MLMGETNTKTRTTHTMAYFTGEVIAEWTPDDDAAVAVAADKFRALARSHVISKTGEGGEQVGPLRHFDPAEGDLTVTGPLQGG
jgi:hypothetical protein